MSNMELRYSHLGRRRTPAREAQRAETVRHIAEIQAEQLRRLDAKFRNLGAATQRVEATRHHPTHLEPSPSSGGPLLQIAARYSAGRIPTTP